MGQVRVHGDPFGGDAAAIQLRAFVRCAVGSGVRCALSLSAVEPRQPAPGERAIRLTDGARDLTVATRLPPAEIESLLRASGVAVAATAPVVVFAPPVSRDDAVHEASLEWPLATSVFAARDRVAPAELLERARAESRWAGREDPPHALDERELAPWLALPPRTSGPIVAVGDGTFASGIDLAIVVWRQRFAAAGQRLRVVIDGGAAEPAAARCERLAGDAAGLEVVAAPFAPEHVHDAVTVLLPFRRFTAPRLLVQALASGRPVCTSRFHAAATLLAAPGICLPIGGRHVETIDAAIERAHFAPHPEAIAAALHRAVDERAASLAIGARARTHVVASLTRQRPAAPPPAVRVAAAARPTVVLEAPFFASSSAAEFAIATAQALVRRDRVDVRLVPVMPMRRRLAALRTRAPEVAARLRRDPGSVDLWLSCGSPVRAARPACRSWAVRVDAENGSLAHELTPHVTQDADVIIGHDEHTLRAVTAAGRPAASVRVVPHGVDAAMHDAVAADADVVAWKGALPAVLFHGALDQGAGFDVFLRATLAAQQAGQRFCLVVVTEGGREFAGLLERFRRTSGTPPVLVIERDMSRAQLAAVFAACDVMLHPHRSVGAHTNVLDARACGLPVLATAAEQAQGVIPIPAARRDVAPHEPHVTPPWVLEPSVEDAGALLAQVLGDLPSHRQVARECAASTRAANPWDVAAAAIEEFAFTAMGRRSGASLASEPQVTLERGPLVPAPVPVP